MELQIIIEFDKETNSYSAYCPALLGCTSCGDTEEEALNNFKEALELYFEEDKRIPENAKVYKFVA